MDAHASAIGRGDLPAGAALPSVRTLAERLRVNVNPVQKAYLDMEGQGLVRSRLGPGVSAHADAVAMVRQAGRTRGGTPHGGGD